MDSFVHLGARYNEYIYVFIFSVILLMSFSIIYLYGCDDSDDCEKQSKQGNAVAQYALGVMYLNGEGIRKNHKEAVKWFSKAAEQGHAKAQYGLGLMYYKGEGGIRIISWHTCIQALLQWMDLLFLKN